MSTESPAQYECHLVCGPPAAGKSHHARMLADRLNACLLDSDQVSERLVRAALELAGFDPDDRDSPTYKKAFREPVYQTLFDLAREHLVRGPVVIAGPFTSETRSAAGLTRLEEAVGQSVRVHFVWCPPDERRQRIESRGEARDRPKLDDWEGYVATCREKPPPWPHEFVNTGR